MFNEDQHWMLHNVGDGDYSHPQFPTIIGVNFLGFEILSNGMTFRTPDYTPLFFIRVAPGIFNIRMYTGYNHETYEDLVSNYRCY